MDTLNHRYGVKFTMRMDKKPTRVGIQKISQKSMPPLPVKMKAYTPIATNTTCNTTKYSTKGDPVSLFVRRHLLPRLLSIACNSQTGSIKPKVKPATPVSSASTTDVNVAFQIEWTNVDHEFICRCKGWRCRTSVGQSALFCELYSMQGRSDIRNTLRVAI